MDLFLVHAEGSLSGTIISHVAGLSKLRCPSMSARAHRREHPGAKHHLAIVKKSV